MLAGVNSKFIFNSNKTMLTSTSKQQLREHRTVDNLIELKQIIPGIYLTSNDEFWTTEKLKLHNFTHIISIDKDVPLNSITKTENDITSQTLNVYNTNSTEIRQSTSNNIKMLNLIFGTTYLAAVLPNCYKAVKFLDKALKSDCAVLVFENSGYQKCLTVVVGYLMFKYNLTFLKAFGIIKNGLDDVELDKYYVTQLYEYEPILQVQRTQMRGHSCSGELRRVSMKRKKLSDDFSNEYYSHPNNFHLIRHHNINPEFCDVMEQ